MHISRLILFVILTLSFPKSGLSATLDPGLRHFFLDDNTPIVLAFFMLLFALYFIWRYYSRIFSPLKRDLETISSLIAKRRDLISFNRHFGEIDAVFRESKYLKDAWREFKETLDETSDPGSGEKVYRNSKRPQDYFHEYSLSQAGVDIKQLEFFPGVFVAVGLVLTFIGLLMALLATNVGIGSLEVGAAVNLTDEAEAIKKALKDLLAASAFKFITSIAGIGCSILLTIVSRFFVNNLDYRLKRIQNHLERGLLYLSNERIQLQIEKEINSLAHGIRDGFSDAITEMSGNELRIFADRMGQIGEELKSTDDIVNQLGESYQGQLKNINSSFVEMSKETMRLARVSQTEMLENQREFLTALSDDFNGHLSRFTSAFNENFDAVKNKLSGFEKAVQANLDTSKSALSSTSETIIENSEEIISQHASQINGSVEAVFNDARENLEELKGLMKQNYGSAISRLNKSNEEFLEASKEQITAHASEIGGNYKKLGEEMAKTVRDASNDFKENIGTNFKALSDTTENIISMAEKSLQSHNSLQDNSASIIQNIGDASQNLTAVKNEVANISKANSAELQNVSENLVATSESIKGFSETVKTKTNTDFDRLAEMIGDLSKSLDENLSHARNFANQGQKTSVNFQDGIDKFADNINESQAELLQTMKDLGDVLKEVATSINESRPKPGFFGR